MQKFFLSGILFFLLSTSTNAQVTDTIPFVLTPHNNIYVLAVLNKTDTLKLMFHTGENGISITEDALARIQQKEKLTTTTVESWGGQNEGHFFKNNSLSIGQLQLTDLTVWVNKRSGIGTDGKFGPALLGNRPIEVDYDKGLFIIHPGKITKTQRNNYHQLKLVKKDGLLFVKGTLKLDNRRIRSQFMIHTGYGGTLLIDDQLAAKYKLGSTLEIIKEGKLKDSYGNIIITKDALLPGFKLGKNALENVSVSFFDGAIGRQKISVLGNGFLKQFNLILDVENAKLFLKPNSLSSIG